MKKLFGSAVVAVATALSFVSPVNAAGNQIRGYLVRAEVEALERSLSYDPFDISDNPYLHADLAIGLAP